MPNGKCINVGEYYAKVNFTFKENVIDYDSMIPVAQAEAAEVLVGSIVGPILGCICCCLVIFVIYKKCCNSDEKTAEEVEKEEPAA